MEYPPGYTCAAVLARLEVYVLRTLTRVEALAIAEHLEACPECAQRLAVLPGAAGGGRPGGPGAHV